MPFRKRLKRQIVWSIARSFDWLINLLPRNTAVAIGGWIGLCAWAILAKDRYKIDRHLAMAYKEEMDASRRREIGRQFFINSGKNLADIVRFKKHFTSEIEPLVTVEGLEHFDAAYRAGKGLIGITGHIGNFELLAAHIASLGYEVAVIGRELSDPRMDAWLTSNRNAAGLTNIATTESPRRILSWLKEGKVLGVLVDTDSTRVRGIAVPFFNRLANTPVGPFQLGLRAGAAFVPICCVRQPYNRYLIKIEPAVTAAPGLSEHDSIIDVTSKCSNALEGFVRTWPDQWIWLHNRWQTRPEDVA